MRFNPDGAFYSLNGKPLKSVYQFIYLSSNISSTESDIKTPIAYLSNIFGNLISDKIKWEFFQTVADFVSLFNAIQTFLGYLIPNPPF